MLIAVLLADAWVTRKLITPIKFRAGVRTQPAANELPAGGACLFISDCRNEPFKARELC